MAAKSTKAPGYSVFKVLQPGEEADELHPVLTEQFAPVFDAGDGHAIESFDVSGILLPDLVDGQFRVRYGSKDLKGTLWVTEQRIVLVCRNYDKVKWDGSNNVDVMEFGLGWGIADHVASKAYHRIRSSGKAMTTHLYFPWVNAVTWSPARDRKNPAALRFKFVRSLTTGNKDYFIEVHLGTTDTGALARRLLQRIGRWYLDGPLDLNENGIAKMTPVANAGPLSVPAPGKLSAHTLPSSYFVSATTTPSALAAKTAENHERAVSAQAELQAQRARALVFRGRSNQSHPPSDFVEVPPKAGEKYESPIGVLVESTKRLWPAGGEELLFHAWGQLRGYVRVDDTGGPDASSDKVIPLCQGIGQLMVTDRTVAIAVTNGTSAAGSVAAEGHSAFIATMPLNEVASIEMAPVTDVPNHAGPDLAIRPKDPSWGAFWISSVGAELVRTEGKWVAERQEGDLVEITARLNALVNRATEPLPHEEPAETPAST
jgi:hypothetical protein